jgi:uncharacterized delta-60 repeat protein
MKKATHMIAGLLAVGLAFGANFAQAQAGTLDTTFGTGGIVTTTIGQNLTSLTAIEQSNGDIAVVTGFNDEGNTNPNGEVVALTRYTSDGTFIGTTIASFFTNGINSPVAVAAQSNGDIVVAATASAAIDGATSFGVARFRPNGLLDKTFGTGGLVITTPAGIFPTVSALIVQPNGQILVGGSTIGVNKRAPSTMVLVRYNPDGSLDTTFGAGGIVEAVAAVASPAALAQLSNGSYLAAGGTASVEFSSTGVLQANVTPGKLVAASTAASACCSPVIFQPNGDFLVAQVGSGSGTGVVADNGERSEVQVSRFTETGTADGVSPAFQFGGNTQNLAQAIALQSNGQIVVGGLTNAHGTPVTGGLARLDSNLQLDTAFASGGSLQSDQIVTGLLIQKDGKIVVVGGIDGNLVLERYLATPGELDPPSGLADLDAR